MPLTNEQKLASDDKAQFYGDQCWRLNNLYKIRDKDGNIVTFRMNDPQRSLYEEHWYLNVILKARQIGITTFLDLLILDTCLFNPNVKGGIIAHHQDDARAIFEEKIKFPYESMDQSIAGYISATTDRAGEIVFSNGSSIRVSTSFRSGTLQILHVSELGKIAAKYPEKAKEIRTGAFEAVATGQKIFVESTAEGREGEFYDLAMDAKKLKDSAATLSLLDFKFHFFPWHENPEYRLDTTGVVFTTDDQRYFKELELHNIHLDAEQCAWWIKKHERLKDEMYREHPSFPEEAFKASIEGSYYGTIIAEIRRKGRIGHVPYEPGYPVHTSWDLGMNDTMTIWFFQQVSRERRIIDYMEGSGVGLPEYAKLLHEKPYVYGMHYLPHDANVRELGTGIKRVDTARELGISPITVVPRPKNNDQLHDQIDQTRAFIQGSWFDEEHCDKGIIGLENYRKEWNDKMGAFNRIPLHNWASHAADGLRTGAVGFRPVRINRPSDLLPEPVADY
jgi:hypothetical protein